jgi:hypothetical protein
MMRKPSTGREVIILDGDSRQADRSVKQKPSPWLPQVKSVLGRKGYGVNVPDLSLVDNRYRTWEAVLNTLPNHEDSIMVGSKLGAYATLRWLSENERQISGLVLVQPRFEKSEPLVVDRDLTARCAGNIAMICNTSAFAEAESLEDTHIKSILAILPSTDVYNVSANDLNQAALDELVVVIDSMRHTP